MFGFKLSVIKVDIMPTDVAAPNFLTFRVTSISARTPRKSHRNGNLVAAKK
jgi:hypothetical protein